MKLSSVSFKSFSAIFLFSKSLAFFTLLALILTTAPAIPKPMAATFPVKCVISPPVKPAKLAAAYLVLYSHHASSNLSAIFRKYLTVFFALDFIFPIFSSNSSQSFLYCKFSSSGGIFIFSRISSTTLAFSSYKTGGRDF